MHRTTQFLLTAISAVLLIALVFASGDAATAEAISHVSADTLSLDFSSFLTPEATWAVSPAVLALRKQRTSKIDEARKILDKAKTEERALTDEEKTQFDSLHAEAKSLADDIERQERQEAADESLEQRNEPRTVPTGDVETEVRSTPGARGPEARAGEDRARRAEMARDVLQMMRGIATGQQDMVRSAQRSLAENGWYGEQGEERAAGDYYSTLVDADGAVLLPTQVRDEIDRLANTFGFARANVSTFDHITGKIVVPGATGSITANFVAEGGEISASMRQFKGVTLNPQKLACIIPWTYEANLEAGPRILEDAEWSIAQAFSGAEDDALFNGNGTAAFNGIMGVFNLAGVGSYQLAAGKQSFDDIDADDLHLARRTVHVSVRNRGGYAFHPDMEPKLRTLKDANGQYLYAFNSDTQVATLGGRPVGYTEKLPAIGADAANTKFGAYGDWRMIKMALGEGMTTENLREAQIKDADTGAVINLATQDLRAIKCRRFMDMGTNFPEAITVFRTAA